MDRSKLVDQFAELADRFPTALADVVCYAQCGRGWSSLVIPVLEACERNGVAVHQIKEKFGGLRIYTERVCDEVDAAISAAEAQARKTCETCGKPGSLRPGGWFKTLCDRCVRK